MKFYAFLMSFLFIFTVLSTSISYADDRLFVGVSPPVVDLGVLGKGTTNVVKFYVVTVSEDTILVSLSPENGRLDFFNDQYKDAIFNYSEESTVGWVKFLSNPVELKPQDQALQTGYSSINGWREVDLLLEIPKDAEPGYHLVKINPSPIETSATKDAIGTGIIAVTSVNVIFRVPGDVKRGGVILDSTLGNHDSNNIEIDTYFQNTGTATITAGIDQKIYDVNNSFVAEVSAPKQVVKPNEIKPLETFLPLTGLLLGDYQVFTTVSYTTDSTYKNSTIALSAEALAAKPQVEEFPIWIFIIIIILVFAFVIYRWVN